MKQNKIVVLIVLILCMCLMLVGCKKTPPEGVSQNFYDDMLKCLDEITHIKQGSFSLEEFKIKPISDYEGFMTMYKYTLKYDELSNVEQMILNSISDAYEYLIACHDGLDYRREFIDSIQVFSALMDIKIDIDK